MYKTFEKTKILLYIYIYIYISNTKVPEHNLHYLLKYFSKINLKISINCG